MSLTHKWDFSRRDLFIAALLVASVFVVPRFAIPESGTIVTAATAIFAIVAGFFIADAMANYLNLQRLIAEENAMHISLFTDLQDSGLEPKGIRAIQDAIDAYLIAQLDADTLSHVDYTRRQFNDLLHEIASYIHALGNMHASLSEHLQGVRKEAVRINQEISLSGQVNLGIVHWSLLILLALVVVVNVLALRDGTFFMNLISVGMLLGTQGILIVLRDMDNNRFLERKLSFKNPHQVFLALNLPPYYPPFAKAYQRVPDDQGRYRSRDADGAMVTMTVDHR